MSVTAVAIPWTLIFSLSAKAFAESLALGAATAGAANILTSDTSGSAVAELKTPQKLHLEEEVIQKTFYNKDFATTIMDEETLIKTLKEHGAQNISKHSGTIECNCQYFHLAFKRKDMTTPYIMTITANDKNGVDEFAEDLGSEYTLNAQEISYNKIKERLLAQNLEISNEEIYEDNTIVLTVDLED